MRKGYLFLLLFLFACNPAPVVTELFPVRIGSQYGFLDRTGKMAIAPQYAQASCFVDGLALTGSMDEKTKWGYIDKSGKYIINPTYADGTSFSEGVAFVVTENSGPMAIDKNGTIKFKVDDALGGIESVENFRSGLAAVSRLTEVGEMWGFIDKECHLKIGFQFKAAGFFSDGLCAVMNLQDKWGFVSKDGTLKIDYKFDNVSPFEGGKAKVLVDDKWGVIDNTGKYIVTPQYANMDIDGNMFLVADGNKFGWLDRNGKILITPRFDDAFPFNGNKYAAVKSGDKWGYIDKSGKLVIQPQFDFAFGYDGDLAPIRSNNKEGFINDLGAVVVQPTFDDMSMDYYLRSFAKTSSFSGVTTNKNAPLFVAYKWLSKFYHMDFEEAKTVSTEDTKNMLVQFASLTNLMPDSSKQELLKIRIAVKDPKENEDNATVAYTTSDNPDKVQTLYLVKKDGQWLVQFSKDDAVAGTSNNEDK